MTNQEKVLDIAMNLTRVGNWAADDYLEKKKRIVLFLKETSDYLSPLKSSPFPYPFKKTFDRFLTEYPHLEKEGREGPQDPLEWAEKLMTWGNILTHRAKLIPARSSLQTRKPRNP